MADPQTHVVLVVVTAEGRLVVVPRVAEEVRQRIIREQPDGLRTDAVGGNDVVGEWRSGSGIVDGDRLALDVERLREVAGAISGARHEGGDRAAGAGPGEL